MDALNDIKYVEGPMKKKLVYVFVHGLSGWGSYDETYKRMPYWGMRGGDLISFLNEQGFFRSSFLRAIRKKEKVPLPIFHRCFRAASAAGFTAL